MGEDCRAAVVHIWTHSAGLWRELQHCGQIRESDAGHTVLPQGRAYKESRSLWFDMRTTGQGEATQSWEGVLLSYKLAFS